MISGTDARGNREVAGTKDRRSISDAPCYREHKVVPARTIKPDQSEFLPYYARYTDLVGAGDIVITLEEQMKETLALLRSLPNSAASRRYAPDKWTVSQMIGHVIDTERIFASRALRFSRNDPQPLPSFDQDHYVSNSNFDAYPLAELVAELDIVRQGTIFQFRHLDEAAWMRRGVASGAEVTVRALAFITAGHELHHRMILQTRYLR
jgi:DinB superfamily